MSTVKRSKKRFDTDLDTHRLMQLLRRSDSCRMVTCSELTEAVTTMIYFRSSNAKNKRSYISLRYTPRPGIAILRLSTSLFLTTMEKHMPTPEIVDVRI